MYSCGSPIAAYALCASENISLFFVWQCVLYIVIKILKNASQVNKIRRAEYTRISGLKKAVCVACDVRTV